MISAPVEKVGENHTGKERRKGRRVTRRPDGIKFVSIGCRHHRKARQDTAVAQRCEAEQRDCNANDKQSNAVECIGNGNGSETTEDGIDSTDAPDRDNRHRQGMRVGETGDGRNVEKLQHRNRARIEHRRNGDKAIAHHKQDNRRAAHIAIETIVEEFRQGRKRAGEVAWQKQKRHCDS